MHPSSQPRGPDALSAAAACKLLSLNTFMTLVKEAKCRLRDASGHKSEENSPKTMVRYTSGIASLITLKTRRLLIWFGLPDITFCLFHLQHSHPCHPLCSHQPIRTAGHMYTVCETPLSPPMNTKSDGQWRRIMPIDNFYVCRPPSIFLAAHHCCVDTLDD